MNDVVQYKRLIRFKKAKIFDPLYSFETVFFYIGSRLIKRFGCSYIDGTVEFFEHNGTDFRDNMITAVITCDILISIEEMQEAAVKEAQQIINNG